MKTYYAHNAKTYFEYHAKAETAHEVVEWDDPEAIEVIEHETPPPELERLIAEGKW